MSEKEKKKSRKDVQKELRKLEQEISGRKSIVDYTKINQRHMDDKRFERELKNKEMLQEQANHGTKKGAEQAPSATYDAFMRMQTGQETRTIADKINDPNRMTWETFRKENEDKLNIPGADQKKMKEYRAQLDAEREAQLAKGRNRPKRKLGVSSSESEGEADGRGGGAGAGDNSDDGGSSSKRKKRKKEKRSKKDKDRDRDGKGSSKKRKHSKSKKSSKRSRKDGDDSGGSTDSDGGSGAEEAKKKRRKDKKKKKTVKESDPKRLSEYLQGSSASDSN